MKKYYEPERAKMETGLEPVPEEVRAAYLRPGELLSIQETFPVAFQPIGTLEWHGRQNPIGCDAIKAEMLCIETAKITGGAVMPTIYFSTDAYRDTGCGVGLGMDPVAGFQLPGSFYKIENETLKSLVKQACINYLSRGFKLVVLVSGHNPFIQENLLNELCYELKTDEGKEPVFFTMEYQVLEPDNPRRHSDHAGHYETSMMLYLNPSRVNISANDNKERPNLAVDTRRPVVESTAEEGEICFIMQVEGLAKKVKGKLENLAVL